MGYELTGLELLLGGGFLSTASAIIVRVTFGSNFVSKAEFAKLQKANTVLFEMVRALIIYSDIPKKKQEEILNSKGAK